MHVNISLLKQQHVGILAANKALIDLMSGTFADAAPYLGQARVMLARLIAEHLRDEDEILHVPLRTHSLISNIPGYTSVADETRELRLRYSAHIGDWPARAVEANWQDYGAKAGQLGKEVIELAMREEREIYPVAQRLLAGVR